MAERTKIKLNGTAKLISIGVILILAALAWAASYGALKNQVRNNSDNIQKIDTKLDKILDRLPPKE